MEHMPERIERTTIYESEHVCLYTDMEMSTDERNEEPDGQKRGS